ncbi:GNAT family N-acetyltransferase [Streptacidiphilus monticola]|uniref:GNAT family N-acetyltransferase n=1 Tax=Streptacidiphilus monticola TaxID=2161674 RepID=A0ABW1G3Z5_9ACTN
MSAPLEIRPYRPSDREGLYEVCVRTGDNGADAAALYPDPRILPDIFVGPYLALEPELAFVLAESEGAGRPVGYILGTADTAAFVARYRARWLPGVADRYPGDGARERELRHPEWMLWPEAAGHPAHLHIDLLPEAQGRGHGRQLMRTYLDALAAAGVGAVHLSMGEANHAARAFYDRLGFTELARRGGGVLMGRATADGQTVTPKSVAMPTRPEA